jgi:hypothetical protein
MENEPDCGGCNFTFRYQQSTTVAIILLVSQNVIEIMMPVIEIMIHY